MRRLRSTSKKWSCPLERRGLFVFCTGVHPGVNESHLLEDQSGVVLGTLFERRNDPSVACMPFLSTKQTGGIISTEGRELITSYWGRYVAFLCDGSGERKWILRDPSGGLPALHTTHEGVKILFSYMEDCLALRLPAFSINWEYVSAHAVARLVDTHETALNEVSELAAGERMEIRGERVSYLLYWQPLRIACSNVIEQREYAVAALRTTVRNCVQSWASGYSGIIHKLSGGLDSSIVLACFRDTPNRPTVHCLNFRSDGSDGDERRFAQLAANHLGYHLIEMSRPTEIDFSEIPPFAKSARPAVSLIAFDSLRIQARIASQYRAQAVFGGVGGDQVFYQNPALLTAADYVHRNGIRKHLFKVALNVACVHGTSVWTVLRQALKDGLSRRQHHPWDTAEIWRYRTLVSSNVLASFREERRFLHPWFACVEDVPPGKLNQIFSLSTPPQYHDSTARPHDPDRVEPLLSQPLMELCLRIPTYILMSDGWDRAIARQAFAQDLPPGILRRRSKGGLEEYVQDILIRNLEYAREMLLDGILVSQGILDPSKLKEVLSGRPTNIFGGLAEIFDHLGTEVWLRNWSLGRRKAAA